MFIFHNWLALAASIATVFVTSEITFLILRFLEVGSSMACYMCIYGIVTEIFVPSKRAVGAAANHVGWGLGMLVVILVAYFVREWKTLQLTLTAPLVLTGVTYPFLMPESPKWLLSRRRYKEAKTALQAIARANGKSFSEETKLSAGLLESKQTSISFIKGLVMIFKSSILTVRLVILTISWFVNAMVYYGVGLNLGSVIPGNIYLNFFIIAMSSLLALPPTVWILSSKGRKVFLCLCMVLGGLFCIATIFPFLGDGNLTWVTALLSHIGKLLLTTSFKIVWLYTTELLPTYARLSGLGFCNFFGRIGAIVSPYIATLPNIVDGKIGQALPLLVFGLCGLVSGMLCLFLPETKNKKLPDTVKEAELLKWRKNGFSKDQKLATFNRNHKHRMGVETEEIGIMKT
ncbi:solute carrier family 22 member 15 [Elysia marginata]|uniref:Solute carrier family 22 member 15 n=1 Tax=Elysia marginata TaxID=1093978 RepID=A0AAV4GIF2_9GAST|nr:solute carrier family 22 member 15 [Elysia marginata]